MTVGTVLNVIFLKEKTKNMTTRTVPIVISALYNKYRRNIF